ncbi:YeeE/YedE family protein [Stutzerimonas kirkiae]|uniref:YeeE/YedE n=1 Tax=Stutzerimonas kirkiae TaxID=2211392 RepID=A0A4Q9RCT7_9GAMM|nr:YeeE/YedE thiosulfate transporter family protein [Stutzerimonas kirkiae]TBU98934.1 YeeE/YedE [Stutzerimonas kirkiae]TBV01584.1 YeeE/YedE [Stutzerimonas kirkiae]TBV10309.1 YeeE/YedE [Stutzerimonas kirkiae]TBV16898.1 YeeE/YedE [Stutzerimonas kirkiae]
MTIDWAAFTPWPALAGGVLLGLGAGLFIMVNGRIAGISGLLGGLLRPGDEGRGEGGLFLSGLLCAPLLWGLFGHWPQPSFQTDVPGLVLAGLLVGLGSRYGSGCTSGHGVCGLARLSPRSLLATLCFMASGFLSVFVIRHLWGG